MYLFSSTSRASLRLTSTGCPGDTECSTRPGYCRRRKTNTTATRKTKTKTKTTTTTRTATTTSADTCPTGVVKRGDEHDLDIQKRQNLQPNCVYECHNGKRIPVVEIENVPGETDQLFFSMCSGGHFPFFRPLYPKSTH